MAVVKIYTIWNPFVPIYTEEMMVCFVLICSIISKLEKHLNNWPNLIVIVTLSRLFYIYHQDRLSIVSLLADGLDSAALIYRRAFTFLKVNQQHDGKASVLSVRQLYIYEKGRILFWNVYRPYPTEPIITNNSPLNI